MDSLENIPKKVVDTFRALSLLQKGILLGIVIILFFLIIRVYRIRKETKNTFILGMDSKKYIEKVRQVKGKLTQVQVDSLNQIFLAWTEYGDGDTRKLAYITATAEHESTFKPIKETYGNTAQQQKYWNTGYFGRGFVQLTWKYNYERMSKILGVDLVKNPDLALNPTYAAKILVYGMVNGVFTGRKLSSYINAISTDFYNSRRIVNGTDKAEKIAKRTQQYLTSFNNG